MSSRLLSPINIVVVILALIFGIGLGVYQNEKTGDKVHMS